MKEKKYYIALDDFERRLVVNCMNEMRNKLIADGKYTDALDEVLLKVIHSKQKKLKVVYIIIGVVLQRLPSRKGAVSLSAINFLDKHCFCGHETILLIGIVHQPMLYLGNKTSPQNVVDAFCSNSIG